MTTALKIVAIALGSFLLLGELLSIVAVMNPPKEYKGVSEECVDFDI